MSILFRRLQPQVISTLLRQNADVSSNAKTASPCDFVYIL